MKLTRLLAHGLLATLAIGLIAGCSEQPKQRTQAPAAAANGLPAFTALVRQAAPSVVRITVSPARSNSQTESPRNWHFERNSLRDWLQRFLDEAEELRKRQPQHHARARMRLASASGFIISEDGYIITSRRLVQGADRVVVHLNGRQMTAELVGADKYSGIALLKVDAEDLNPVDIGSVDALNLGAWVLALGAPPGVETSVTAGIVSAKGRNLAGKQYVPFIQSDVTVTPRAVGGPLLSMQGEVVGVNAPTYGRVNGYRGLSFAIPIDLAMAVAEDLMADGSVERGWLGVQIQQVTASLASSFGMQRPHGALIAHIVSGTPAAESSLKAGDVIVKYNGEPVPRVSALPPLVARTDPGKTVDIVVVRNGEKQTVEVEIGELNQSPWTGSWAGDPAGQGAASNAALGLRLRALTDNERKHLGIPTGGVRILELGPGLARRAGLEAGDVIATVNAQPVTSPDALRKRLTEADEPVALRVLRDGRVRYIAFDPDP